jgi:hypothetical protein
MRLLLIEARCRLRPIVGFASFAGRKRGLGRKAVGALRGRRLLRL